MELLALGIMIGLMAGAGLGYFCRCLDERQAKRNGWRI